MCLARIENEGDWLYTAPNTYDALLTSFGLHLHRAREEAGADNLPL